MTDEDIDRHIGKRMRSIRRGADIRQSEIAAALGISESQVQRYERGTNSISVPKLFKVAAELKVPLVSLFDGLL